MVQETKIKLCGMFRPEDIGYVNQVRPDYCGFVLAPGFRRQITKEQAARFRRALHPDIAAVGVFVNQPCGEVIRCLEEGVIQMAQLHGDETEEDIRRIREAAGKPVVKAVKVKSRCDVEAWLDSEADYLLFDAGTGMGVSFDWAALEGVERNFFLAGGLHAGNIRQAVETVRPYGVDLSSGIETGGVKDLEKMREVMAALGRAG